MTKNELRQAYKLKRQAFSDKEISAMSSKIFQSFNSNFNFEGKHISIFIPIEKFKEVNTWDFLNNYPADFYLPVVKQTGLEHIEFESLAQLKQTDWGILEPISGKQASADSFDLVLVPLLAYDTKGNRVGYGKGFYDGFLKNCKSNCLFIGLSFFEPEIEIIKTIPSDIRLHYCITPKVIHKFN